MPGDERRLALRVTTNDGDPLRVVCLVARTIAREPNEDRAKNYQDREYVEQELFLPVWDDVGEKASDFEQKSQEECVNLPAGVRKARTSGIRSGLRGQTESFIRSEFSFRELRKDRAETTRTFERLERRRGLISDRAETTGTFDRLECRRDLLLDRADATRTFERLERRRGLPLGLLGLAHILSIRAAQDRSTTNPRSNREGRAFALCV
jgi:hypothetical protein